MVISFFNKFKDRFVIYSAGKFEYRKAQDVVSIAFREFQKRHSDALLIFAWANQWTKIMPTIKQSNLTIGCPDVSGQNDLLIDEWLVKNGLSDDNPGLLFWLPGLSYESLDAQTDVE